MTNKQRCKPGEAKAIAFKAFEDFPRASNKEIAQKTGLGYSTVCQQRQEYIATPKPIDQPRGHWDFFLLGTVFGAAIMGAFNFVMGTAV